MYSVYSFHGGTRSVLNNFSWRKYNFLMIVKTVHIKKMVRMGQMAKLPREDKLPQNWSFICVYLRFFSRYFIFSETPQCKRFSLLKFCDLIIIFSLSIILKDWNILGHHLRIIRLSYGTPSGEMSRTYYCLKLIWILPPASPAPFPLQYNGDMDIHE